MARGTVRSGRPGVGAVAAGDADELAKANRPRVGAPRSALAYRSP
ncbi:hypothetical protein HMPREF9006_1147 [Actinomyces sp. oral taxon 180 str. F0310]|nr:hypothetical protein HMPREF9006_1147 [Actinomyces sp. oral taxon 180 str. F0310]